MNNYKPLDGGPPKSAADEFIQEMLKHADKMVSLKVFDSSGVLKEQIPFFLPIYGMYCMLATEAGVLVKLDSGSTQHTWGFHLDPVVFLECASEIRAYMLLHPELGVDDGIAWQGGLSTRQIVWDFIECVLIAPIDSKCSLIIDHHNEVPCPCALCSGYAPPCTTDDVLAQDSFKRIWAEAKLAKINRG